MSDLTEQEQADLVEAAKSRDQRLQLIDQALQVQAELRDSATWRYLAIRIGHEKDDIAAKLAEIEPNDLGAVGKLQARAIAMTSIPRWLNELISAGRAMEQDIAAEDGRLPSID